MTSPYGIEQLRVEVPTLEPDAVLLAQLVELSSASAPSTTSSRASSMRVLLAAAGVAVVATTTWAAGAVPGKLFPTRPASHPHTVVPHTTAPSPSSGPTATRTPGASRPTSEAPGVHPTHRTGQGPARAGDLPSLSSLPSLFGATPSLGVHAGEPPHDTADPGRSRGHHTHPDPGRGHAGDGTHPGTSTRGHSHAWHGHRSWNWPFGSAAGSTKDSSHPGGGRVGDGPGVVPPVPSATERVDSGRHGQTTKHGESSPP